MDEKRKPKPWTCPSCKNEIGSVLYGQLYLNGNLTVNTDGANIVVKCPYCDARKIWYTRDRIDGFISDLADQIAHRLSGN